MRKTFLMAMLLAACLIAHSQAAPSASSGAAYFRYSGYYSEAAQFGDTLGTWHTITPSASVDYANGKRQFPFNLDYAGGYTSTLSGPPYTTGFFQRLLISQGITRDRWNLKLSNDVSYTPQTPTTGFSGMPGTGEPIGGGINPPSSQLILAVDTHALENTAHAQFQHVLNHRSILNVELTQDFLHFPDNNGYDTNSGIAGVGFDFRLDARNLLTTRYIFSEFGYLGYDFRISTNMGTIGFNRSWTRALTTTAAVGPEWVASSNGAILSDSLGVAANAMMSYKQRQKTFTLNYARATTAGSGYMIGSETDNVYAGLSRQFNRPFQLGMTVGYSRNHELVQKWNLSGVYGGVQTSWRIGRYLNAFVNYTAMSQNPSSSTSSNVLNELLQTISCGIGFTKETRQSR